MLTTNWGDLERDAADHNTVNRAMRDTGEIVRSCYQRTIKMLDSTIRELRQRLSQIPVLIADFDDTLTSRPDEPNNQANRSIFAILEKLETLPHKKEDLEVFYESWDKVNTFYSHALRGLTREELFSIYKEVIQENNPQKAVRLNPNFLDACRILHHATGAIKIPLFVLSLNSYEFISVWFESKQQELAVFQREKGIEIILVAIMGNQVIYDNEDRVAGVIQHVTNNNKAQFIPDSAIVVADIRETRTFLDRGCNVVDLEKPCYYSDITRMSIECHKMIFSKERIIRNFPEMAREIDKILEFARAIKERNEERTLYQHPLSNELMLTQKLRIDINEFKYKYSQLIKKIQTLLSLEERREQ